MAKFNYMLKRLAEAKGMTERTVEKRLLMYRGKISKFRAGTSSPTVADIKAAQALLVDSPIKNEYKERLLEALIEIQDLKKEIKMLKIETSELRQKLPKSES